MIEIVLARWQLQQPRRPGGRLNAEEAVKGQFGDAVLHIYNITSSESKLDVLVEFTKYRFDSLDVVARIRRVECAPGPV